MRKVKELFSPMKRNEKVTSAKNNAKEQTWGIDAYNFTCGDIAMTIWTRGISYFSWFGGPKSSNKWKLFICTSMQSCISQWQTISKEEN